ncbi:hypothetical protein [Mycoplasma sp. P36-A1]|uniref:hypothetical protein n=1 Tax=Mycoplasma sp. P36-A1 TaxID=3252900 RepID=UPI003C2AC969
MKFKEIISIALMLSIVISCNNNKETKAFHNISEDQNKITALYNSELYEHININSIDKFKIYFEHYVASKLLKRDGDLL